MCCLKFPIIPVGNTASGNTGLPSLAWGIAPCDRLHIADVPCDTTQSGGGGDSGV